MMRWCSFILIPALQQWYKMRPVCFVVSDNDKRKEEEDDDDDDNMIW